MSATPPPPPPPLGDKQPFSGLELSSQEVSDLLEGVFFSSQEMREISEGIDFSSQEIEDLLEGVDFTSPVHQGETGAYGELLEGLDFSQPSPSPPSPVPAPECGLLSSSNYDELVCLYHVLQSVGCKTCEPCREARWRMACVPASEYSTDSVRAIPRSTYALEQSIVVSSLSSFFNRWCAQPRDDYEWALYEEEMADMKVYNAIEKMYWSEVESELNYLCAWETMYRQGDGDTRKRRNDSQDAHKPYKFSRM